jgi:PEGA domain
VARALGELETHIEVATHRLAKLEERTHALRAGAKVSFAERIANVKNTLTTLIDGHANSNATSAAARLPIARPRVLRNVLRTVIRNARGAVRYRVARLIESTAAFRLPLFVVHGVLFAVVAGVVLVHWIDQSETAPLAVSEPLPHAPNARLADIVLIEADSPSISQSTTSVESSRARATSSHPTLQKTQAVRNQPPHFAGTLAVESVPLGAVVLIDQRKVGATPIELSDVPAGSHALWLELEGYQRWTTAATVPANKVTRIAARLAVEP